MRPARIVRPGSLKAADLAAEHCDHTGRIPKAELIRLLTFAGDRKAAETAVWAAITTGDLQDMGLYIGVPIRRTAPPEFSCYFIARDTGHPYAETRMVLDHLAAGLPEPPRELSPGRRWLARCPSCWEPDALEIQRWPAGTDLRCFNGCPGPVLVDATWAHKPGAA